MNESENTTIDRRKLTAKQAGELFAGAILLLYVGILTRWLIVTGFLNLYINPRFNLLSDVTSWVCVIVGLGGLVVAGQVLMPAWRERLMTPNISGRTLFAQGLRVSVLVWLFLLVTILLPPVTLSSRMAQQRVGGLSSTLEPVEISIVQKWIDNTDNYDVGEWVKLFAAEPDPETYLGRNMQGTGFIYHDPAMPEGQFLLGRFIVRCCVVDATPAGIMVLWPGWQEQFSAGQWVKVKGTFGIAELTEGAGIVAIPNTVELTSVPANPYLY
jgi:uncharacterized repeat protein (TIGR03943 family)